MSRSRTHIWTTEILLLCLCLCPGCTRLNEEYEDPSRGTAGEQCKSGRICSSGLFCNNEMICVRNDAGPDVAPMPDVLPKPKGPCANPPAPPLLHAYPEKTMHKKVALSGTADKAVGVAVVGGTKSPLTVPVKAGAFCVEVGLNQLSMVQTLYVVALDSNGCSSKPTVAQVTFSPVARLNLMYNKPVAYKDAPSSGYASYLTDGKVNRTVRFTAPTSPWIYCEPKYHNFLWFDLKDLQTIDKLMVKYPQKSSKYHVMCWRVLISKLVSPKNPSGKDYGPDWVQVYAKGNEKSASPEISFSSPVQARHVALILYEDGEYYGNPEYFDFTEIEAWGQPRPPSCK